MAYSFDRFSPQSFERFIQALASAITGTRVQVFGAGRDGAREATVDGEISYLDYNKNGYTVFQAKYLARQITAVEGLNWVKRQIDLELLKYADQRRELKKPEFYVFATNARLSASAANAEGKGEGGIDAASDYLKQQSAKVGIHDTHLWHADTLSSLVDAYPSLKISFANWIESSDVLAAMMRNFKSPDQYDTLLRYIRRGIQQSRDVKTRDAGQTLSRTLNVSDVFVDLPIDTTFGDITNINNFDLTERDEEVVWQATRHDLDQDSRRNNAVHSIVERASNVFSPSLAVERKRRRKNPEGSKILILGGPGQGKSTVSQFVSQLYRAVILDLDKSKNTSEVNSIVSNIKRRALKENIKDNPAIRLPIQVELPRFADDISRSLDEKGQKSIFAYVAELISISTDTTVDSGLLQDWLKITPSIFVLDGLDEVPPSGSRERVIDAINQLSDFITELSLDAMVIVTSRPQGYQDELSRKDWLYWTLEELEISEALSIANALAPNLITDSVRREEVLEILTSAATDDATAALMVSPLQVSLLFNLVASHNNIPKDRWTLFYRHYDTLRDREIAKGGPTGRLIGEYKSHIDRLHYNAGFILHVRAEQKGNANPYFLKEEFTELITKLLEDDGFDDHEVTKTASAIAEISTDRLVFLRSGVEGQIAFDVRSLQEFMAAARLTLSPESAVIGRLTEIAGKAHWLHVLKIAASRIYGSVGIEALRDPFIALLDALNNGDHGDEARLTSAGSQIALELLTDGAALTVPLYRRRLFVRACALLSAPHQSAPVILARLIDQSTKQTAEIELAAKLNNGGWRSRQNAIRMLIAASNEGLVNAEWIDERVATSGLSADEDYAPIVTDVSLVPQFGKLRDWFIESQLYHGPSAAYKWHTTVFNEPSEISDTIRSALVLQVEPRLHSAYFHTSGGVDNHANHALAVTFVRLAPSCDIETLQFGGDERWSVLKQLIEFQRSPTAVGLAAIIRNSECLKRLAPIPLPWIVSAVLQSINVDTEPADVAALIEQGAAGTPSDWLAAEDRWDSTGIGVSDLLAVTPDLQWLQNVARLGGPIPVGRRLARPDQIVASEIATLINVDRPDSWAVRTLLAVLRRTDPSPFCDLLISLKPKIAITQRMLIDTLLRLAKVTSGRNDVISAMARLLRDNSDSSVSNIEGIDTVVLALERPSPSLELIELVARFSVSYHGSREIAELVRRAALVGFRHTLSGRIKSSQTLLVLQTMPETIDVEQSIADIKSVLAYRHFTLHLLGKSSTHPLQARVARGLAASVLLEEEGLSKVIAFAALANDFSSRTTSFLNNELLNDLYLPSTAIVEKSG